MFAPYSYIKEIKEGNGNDLWHSEIKSETWLIKDNSKRSVIFSPENGCTCVLSREEMKTILSEPFGYQAQSLRRLMSIKVALPLPKKRLIVIALIGDGCMANCRYCFIPQGIPRSGIKDLSLIRKAIERNQGYGDIFVDFSGELGKYCAEIISAVQELSRQFGERIKFSVQTAGYDLDVDTTKSFGDQGFSFGISFDGTPELHEFHRRQSSIPTIRLLPFLTSSGYPCLVRSTISRYSLEHAVSIWTWMEDLGVRSVVFNKLRPAVAQSDIESPSDTEWFRFCESWFSWSFRRGFPRLCDDTMLKWFHRFGSGSRGWTHFCSTAWCESHSRIMVLNRADELLDCARYWECYPPKESNLSGFMDCNACICRFYCGGGCRIERIHPKEHKFMCSYKKWIIDKFINSLLYLPESDIIQFGFASVPIPPVAI